MALVQITIQNAGIYKAKMELVNYNYKHSSIYMFHHHDANLPVSENN